MPDLMFAALACVIVGVYDGDTLTARCQLPEAQVNLTVRIAEIDAPEKRQAFGSRSTKHLAALCFKKLAIVEPTARDRYGRTVAKVACDGTDAGVAQVRAGMAWVFDRYASDRSLYELQREARALRLGLWADAEPMAPWRWRVGTRTLHIGE